MAASYCMFNFRSHQTLLPSARGQYVSSVAPHSHRPLVLLAFFILAVLEGTAWCLFVVCISLRTKDAEHLFSFLPFYFLFCELSIHIFCPFKKKKKVACLFIIELQSSLYILATSPFYIHCGYFLLVCGLPFHFHNHIF